jgi:hypothetical protein
VLEVGDDHHVPGEALGHGERLGERLEQEVPELELGPDDHMAVVELPRDEAAVKAPIEKAVAPALGDALELSGEPAEFLERQSSAPSYTPMIR